MELKITAAGAILAAASIVVSAAAHADTIQVTAGSGQRSFATGFFGGGFGQSFTAIDSSLTSIGFQFEGLNPTFAGVPYTLTLVAGDTLTGSALVSRSFTLPTAIDGRTPVWFDVDIGATAATIGQRYTAVLSSTDTRNGPVLGPDINIYTGAVLGGDAYAGGRALFATVPYPNCSNTAASACDFNFRVTGTTPVAAAVPEPASWALMIGGFGLVGAAIRRRPARPALA